MKFRASVSAILILIFFLSNAAEAAYDLPKIKIEKNISPAKENVIKSDWKNFEQFEKNIKSVLEKNPNLSPASAERVGIDKNLVFIAFYKNIAYFLDKYSIKILKNNENVRAWEQHIFPVGEKISNKTARMTAQKFRFENKNFYNSSRRKNDLNNLQDAEDKNFLQECFKVGYYYAFKEEVD